MGERRGGLQWAGETSHVQKLLNAPASLTVQHATRLWPGLGHWLRAPLHVKQRAAICGVTGLPGLPAPGAVLTSSAPILLGESGVRAQGTPVPSGESASELAAGRPSAHCVSSDSRCCGARALCPPPRGQEPSFTWGFSSLAGGSAEKHPGALQPRPLPSHGAMTEAGSLALCPRQGGQPQVLASWGAGAGAGLRPPHSQATPWGPGASAFGGASHVRTRAHPPRD